MSLCQTIFLQNLCVGVLFKQVAYYYALLGLKISPRNPRNVKISPRKRVP